MEERAPAGTLGSPQDDEQGASPVPSPAFTSGREVHDETCARLHEELTLLKAEHRRLLEQTRQLHQSLGWVLVHRLTRLRGRLFPRESRRATLWRAFAGLVKSLIGARDRGYRGRSEGTGGKGGPAALGPRGTGPQTFRDLPWSREHHLASGKGRDARPYSVLLVTHDASQTGAPLCMLRLARQLAQVGDLECWVLQRSHGALATEFAQVAPVLDVERLEDHGIIPEDAPGLVARLFREHAPEGVAICNTVVVADYVRAFAQERVSVLAWVHELPTFVETVGGKNVLRSIARAARRIVVPADYVRDAHVRELSADPSQYRTIYNGACVDPGARDRDRDRDQVLAELGLPRDARIVLGCGSVETRKGVDLFVQLARRVLDTMRRTDAGPAPWFIWVGRFAEPATRVWLDHDLARTGLRDRVRFLGPRKDPSPYFNAADLFALTSREDPCPLVTVEAMCARLPVVAFQECGGAPEVFRDSGVAVPYLDVTAMADVVLRLIAEPSWREALGRQARSLATDVIGWERLAHQFLDVLREDYGYQRGIAPTPSDRTRPHFYSPHRRGPSAVFPGR